MNPGFFEDDFDEVHPDTSTSPLHLQLESIHSGQMVKKMFVRKNKVDCSLGSEFVNENVPMTKGKISNLKSLGLKARLHLL